MNAQDLALGREARARGLLGPEQLAHAERSLRGSLRLAHVLVRDRLVSGLHLAQLLEELRARPFACASCGTARSFDQLGALAALACPACGGELRLSPAPGAPTSWSGPPPSGSGALDPGGSSAPRGPTHIGPWRVLSCLGRGSFGVVYLAERPGIARRFAVKVLRPDAADAESVARFRIEAAAASKVEDPGVVAVVDVGVHGAAPYYAMEHCAGPTLKERLEREGPLPWREAATILAAVARTVAAVHAAGVVHRDLKPANVILDERAGRPKVTDFGLARAADLARSLTKSGDLLGTPLYMAPEQLQGDKGRDPRVDVYALGATLYTALTGRAPHEGAASLSELTHAVLHDDPPPVEQLARDVPAALAATCRRALRRDPARRTPSAAALADELEALLAQDAAAPAPSPAGAPARRRAAALALSAVALAGLALVAGVARRGPEAPTAASTPTAPASSQPPPAAPTPAPATVETPAPDPAPAELPWALAYYMPYDQALSRLGPEIVDGLAQGVSAGPGVVVTVQADFEGPGGVTRYVMRPGAAAPEVTTLPDLEASASVETLRDWLRWVEETTPARRLALVLLGYGGRLDQSSLDRHPGQGAAPEWLSLPDVADALTAFRERVRAAGREVELVFLQQAARGQLETLHAMRGAARVVMASQATLGAPNRYYTAVVRRLGDEPPLDGRALARAIAESDTPDMFAAYSALDGAALDELAQRIDDLLAPLVDGRSVTLDPEPLRDAVTFVAQDGAGQGDDEVFVDGLPLLAALVTQNGGDPAALERFRAWARDRLLVVHVASPLAGERFQVPGAKDWCGFSLLLPRSPDQLRRYDRRYDLLRRTYLGEVWRRVLAPR